MHCVHCMLKTQQKSQIPGYVLRFHTCCILLYLHVVLPLLSGLPPLIMVKYKMIVHVHYKYHQYGCVKYVFFPFFQVPATREVLSSLPSVLSALCLNNRGLQAFMRCKPFDKLFRVLLSPDYLPAMRRRRTSETLGRPISVLVLITMR